jgi:hypothetical protein
MLDEQHDRVLNRMSAGALDHDAHVAGNTTAARPILRHASDDPNRCGERPRTRISTDGRYWARTSDLRLVEAALSQLS